MHIHEPRKLAQIPGFQRTLALQAEVFDEVQIFNHPRVGLFRFLVLLFQNRRRRTRITGEKEEQIVFEIVARFIGKLQWPRFNFAIGKKFETSDAAVSRDVLILFADGFLEAPQFDFARLRGEFGGMHQVFFVGVQRLEQCDGETAGRTESRAGGNVGHRSQFQSAPVQAKQGKSFTEDRVLQLRRVRHTLQFGIFDDEVGYERFMQCDVNIFINCRGDEKSAELLVVRRQIRPAAAERDTKWRTRDDHKFNIPLFL